MPVRETKPKKPTPSLARRKPERGSPYPQESAEFAEWRRAREAAFPDLKPSLKSISLRLPEAMIADLKLLARKRDIPYQSLLKVFLSERIAREIKAQLKAKQGLRG